MKITKPVFITGVGRSGSTVFHRMLAEHPNFAYLTSICDKYPGHPEFNHKIMKFIDYPGIGKFVSKKYGPSESYNFWERYSRGFRRPCRDLLAEDLTPKTSKMVQKVLSGMLTAKRNRLLIKLTGWPRIGFVNEIFNEARFIHVLRDGRAVTNSMVNVGWWWGWQGPQNWRWGELTNDQRNEWEKYNKSFVALAAIEWKILMEANEQAKKKIDPDRYMEIKYEDLCEDPSRIFKQVFDFSEMNYPDNFNNTIAKYRLKNTNHKWQTDLSDLQKSILEEVLSSTLHKYAYED